MSDLRVATIAGLRQLHGLYSEDGTWCQFAAARNAIGLATLPQGPEAVSWCISGAIGRIHPAVGNSMLAELTVSLGGRWVADWNDDEGRIQKDVLDVIAATIKRLENPCPEPTPTANQEASSPSASGDPKTYST